MDQYEQGDLAGLREHVHEDAEIQVVLRLVTYFRSAYSRNELGLLTALTPHWPSRRAGRHVPPLAAGSRRGLIQGFDRQCPKKVRRDGPSLRRPSSFFPFEGGRRPLGIRGQRRGYGET